MRLLRRFAALMVRPSGVPSASTTRCRLVPALPRSVGLGPVSEPPFRLVWRHCRARPGASPGDPPRAAVPAAPDAAPPKHRRRATPPAAASTSCRCSPSRRARPATGCLVRSTKRIPVSATRSGTRGLPPFSFGASAGSSDRIAPQRSSETRGAAVASQRPDPGFVPSSWTSIWSSGCSAVRRALVRRLNARFAEIGRQLPAPSKLGRFDGGFRFSETDTAQPPIHAR